MRIELPPIPSRFFEQSRALLDRVNRSPESLGVKLGAVYRLLNDMVPFVAGFTTCSRGCSHCCRIDVQITTFEAEYIYMHTGVPHVNESPATAGHRGTPCPFLRDNGECGIYAVRPMICRTYHAAGDPALCADPNAQQILYGSTIDGKFGNPIYAGWMQWVHHQNAAGRGAMKDIRDFFPHPREQIQAQLQYPRGEAAASTTRELFDHE